MITFNQLTEKDPDVVMVVDALNLAFRWKHYGSKVFRDAYISVIKSLQSSYKAKYVIIACDSGKSSYRKELYPDYKKNREDKFNNQTAIEKQEFEEFFREFNSTIDYIISENIFPVFRFKGCEADDIGAYIVTRYSKHYNIWLISSDKDWDLLINDKTSRFSYVTREETTINNWDAHYEFPPDDYISIKCLMGDSGDNIPGVDGIGIKKANALVREYGSTYDIIASIPITSKYKHIKNINEFGANALLLNYKLMDLVSYCDTALGKENCEYIDKVLEEVFKNDF